MISTRAR